MKLLHFLLFIFCVISSITAENEKVELPVKISGKSMANSYYNNSSETTIKSNEKPTTTNSNTTTSSSTTTTSATTSKTTTSITTTSTTTMKPTSTPSPSPSPSPEVPEIGNWNVTQPGSKMLCIMAKMAIQLEMINTTSNETKIVNVPKNATASGTCDANKDVQNLALMWNATKEDNDSITFTFRKNSTTSDVNLGYISVVMNGVFNGTAPMMFTYNHTEFDVPVARSYKCKKEQNLILSSKIGVGATLKVSHVQIQAFRDSKTDNFDDAIDCMFSTPDIVPIAVGCALAVLVVIVLLAFLYGRRRTLGGYLSMISESKKEEDYIPMQTFSCFK